LSASPLCDQRILPVYTKSVGLEQYLTTRRVTGQAIISAIEFLLHIPLHPT